MIAVHGVDREDLQGRLQWLLNWLDERDDTEEGDSAAEKAELQALAQMLAGCIHPGGRRLAMIVATFDELRQRVTRALQKLGDPQCQQIRDVGGIYYTSEPLYKELDPTQPGGSAAGQVAFIYPGEGAQYLGMLGDLLCLPEVRECFDEATETLSAEGSTAVAPIHFTTKPEDPAARETLEVQLKQLDNAMLTVLVADWALNRVLQSMGVPCVAGAGHSAGELAALMMSDTIYHGDGMLGPLLRSFSELEHSPGVDAMLLAVGASRDASLQLLDELKAAEGKISAELAMDNCPHQTVIVGLAEDMKAVEAKVQQRGWVYERLELARPYHTELFESLMGPLRTMFADVGFRNPSPPVYSCTTAELFPETPNEIRDLCVRHWRCRVEFVQMIRKMYDDGIRIFVEAGPRGNLCSFVEDILRGKPFLATPANVQRRHGLTQLQHVAAQLYIHEVPIDFGFFWRDQVATDQVAADVPASDAATVVGEVAPEHLPAMPPGSAVADAQATRQGPVSGQGQVMQSYLGVMDDFLQTQEMVMHQYLTGKTPAIDDWGSASMPPLIDSVALPADNVVDHLQPSYEEQSPNGNGHAPEVHRGAHDDLDPFGPPDGADPHTRPMIGDMLEYEEGKALVMRRRLDLEEDVYADHHTVGGRSLSRIQPDQHGLPIMPLTFTVEMMAEVGQALLPHLVVREVKNVQLMRWLAFFDGDPSTIELSAKRLDQDDEDKQQGQTRVLIQIRNLGNESSQDTARFVAAVGTVVLAETPLEPDCEYTPFDLPGAHDCECTLEVLYMNLFHGEYLQNVETLDYIADKGIEGTIFVKPREGLFTSDADPQFIGDPVLLDVAMHPPVAWHLAEPDQSGRILLPFELKSMEFFGRRPPAHHRFKARTRIVETTVRHFAHLTEVFDMETGKIWARINRVKLWRFYLPFRDVNFHGPKDIYFISTEWPEVVPDFLTDQITCVHMLPLEDLKGPALLGAAARVMMSPGEYDRFENLDRPMDQKPKFLFGRIVAKDAVRYHQRKHNDQRVFLADVEIDANERGRPMASPRGETRPEDYPTISISHCDGMICAMAASHPWVGIDIEPVADREASFERIAFSPSERSLLDEVSDKHTRNELVARFWCAKEAVSKALGEGLVEGPRSLTVQEIDAAGQILVSLGPTLAAGFPEFADDLLVAWTKRDGEFVVATSLCWRHSDILSE